MHHATFETTKRDGLEPILNKDFKYILNFAPAPIVKALERELCATSGIEAPQSHIHSVTEKGSYEELNVGPISLNLSSPIAGEETWHPSCSTSSSLGLQFLLCGRVSSCLKPPCYLKLEAVLFLKIARRGVTQLVATKVVVSCGVCGLSLLAEVPQPSKRLCGRVPTLEK